MIIRSLIEDRSISKDLLTEHGLSLAIQTNQHLLLFDLGASDALVANATAEGVNLADVDLAVISHGHADHGGGLKVFLAINDHAPVYVSKKAFEMHYSQKYKGYVRDVSLDHSLLSIGGLILVEQDLKISDELMIFSLPTSVQSPRTTQESLFKQDHEELIRDDFDHEQHLLIESEGKTVLVSGCAHKGIVNIVNHAKLILGHYPDVVISGFHLVGHDDEAIQSNETILKLAGTLKETKAKYYTYHCTGYHGFKLMKSVMGDSLEYLATGNILLL